jgi:sugar phosphate isomerase/epimerase
MTRREWIAASLMGTAAATLRAAAVPPVLGASLTASAALLRRDPEGTLKAIADIGYRDVEGFSRVPMLALAPKLKAYGLALRSCPIETPLVTADWEAYPEFKQVSLDEAIDSLKNAGADSCTLGYISPGARGDADDFYRRAADRMNVVAERCRRAGMRFAWQNHAFEFAGRAGLRPVDIYKERLDPKLVGLELDVFWASAAGQNPLALLKEWKGRVWLVRLADKAQGTPLTTSENIGDGTFADLGSGTIEFAPILKAAPAAGCRYYFAGPERAEDPIASLRKSFTWLKNLISS